jgi:light-regulated signal transduction histidine kinase (bacteriophytochrome)
VKKRDDHAFGAPAAFPLYLFISLLVVIFCMATFMMTFLPRLLPSTNNFVRTFTASSLLTLIIAPFLYFLILRELKDRRRVEKAMEQRSRELTRSNAELEQFAYVVSHDLREPLRMIHVFLQLLDKRYRGRLDNEADEFIGFTVDGAARMQKMINDLLDYSRVGSRGRELPVKSDAALKQALDNLMMVITECGAIVTQSPLPTVVADESQLVRLFQNLVANAVKFHGKDLPRVHVGAVRQKEEWLFSVCDNGIGIAPEHFERIFLIFKRIYSQSEYPGTGIGLAVCKKIVEQHGGRIWVESQLGVGTTFFFTLPLKGGGEA